MDGGSYLQSNEADNDNGNEVLCISGTGKSLDDNFFSSGLEYDDFELGDAVCGPDCDLVSEIDNTVDYCNFDFGTDSGSQDSNDTSIDDDDNGANNSSAISINNKLSMTSVVLSSILGAAVLN